MKDAIKGGILAWVFGIIAALAAAGITMLAIKLIVWFITF